MNLRHFPHPLNVVKSRRWTTPFSPDYMDETSRLKIDCDVAFCKKMGKTYVPKPWQNYEYLLKNDLGRVHLGGFFHERVAHAGPKMALQELSQNELKKRLQTVWNEHLHNPAFRPTAVTMQRFIFSFSGPVKDEMLRLGIAPDEVMHRVIRQSLKKFRERFHPGDAVGYAYGLHHDSDHLHAHVFLHPRTKNGRFVGLSQQLEGKINDNGQDNQLAYLHSAAKTQLQRIVRELNPAFAPELKHQREEKLRFAKKPRLAQQPARQTHPGFIQVQRRRAQIEEVRRRIDALKLRRARTFEKRRFAVLFGSTLGKTGSLIQRAAQGLAWTTMALLQKKHAREMEQYRQELTSFYEHHRQPHAAVPTPHLRRRRKVSAVPQPENQAGISPAASVSGNSPALKVPRI